jgi:hypothetical protein
VTFAVACADCPLAEDVQVRTKLTINGAAGTNGSVTAALPLVAFVPGQPSLAPPPVAAQLVALVELHIIVVDCPALIAVGDADRDALTGGHVTTTGTADCPVWEPAVHVSP